MDEKLCFNHVENIWHVHLLRKCSFIQNSFSIKFVTYNSKRGPHEHRKIIGNKMFGNKIKCHCHTSSTLTLMHRETLSEISWYLMENG